MAPSHRALALALTSLSAASVMAFVPAGSATAATGGCGSACTGKAPTYVFDGQRCDSSRVPLASTTALGTKPRTYPASASSTFDVFWNSNNTGGDPYLQASWYYSVHCRTIWVDLRNTKAIGRTSTLVRGLQYPPGGPLITRWTKPFPDAGTGWKSSPMVDDITSSTNSFSEIEIRETWGTKQAVTILTY